MKCMECEEAKAEHEDPRRPPLDEGVCLCKECYASSLEDEIERLGIYVDDLTEDLKKVRPDSFLLDKQISIG